MKKRCAQKALAYIQDGMVIGLGGDQRLLILHALLRRAESRCKS